MIERIRLLVAFSILANFSFAQAPERTIRTREQLWVGAFNQTRISDRWGLLLDFQYRRTDNFADHIFQTGARAGVSYYILDNLRLSAGYALFQHFPARTFSNRRTEHRLWQQIYWNQKYRGFTTTQHIRTEQRYQERVVSDVRRNGFDYHFRLRYSLGFLLPLQGKDIKAKTVFGVIVNEVFLNFGSRITFNTFDQNRLFAGMGYQLSSQLNAQLGYMYIFQQDSSGNSYWSTHALRLFLVYTPDLRHRDN